MAFIAILAVLAVLASYATANLFSPVIHEWHTGDVYFSADIPRAFANMTDHQSNYRRTAVHPLVPLVMYVPVKLLRMATGTDAIRATRVVIAAVAGVWAALIFFLLRRLGCRRGDAVLFTLLAIVSAAAMFWFAVPETYGFGSLTILLGLLLVVEATRRPVSTRWLVALNIIGMSVTLSNWMVAILATLAVRPWRQTCRIAAIAFAIVLALSACELAFFSRVRPPFYSLQEEAGYTQPLSLAALGRRVASFSVHSMVLPGIRFVDNAKHPEWPKMRVAHGLRAWSGLSTVAAALWIALLAVGTISFLRLKRARGLRLVLIGTLAGQLALHLVYGDETFLYSLHWLPFLVILAAMSTLERARLLALLLCGALVVCAAYNNVAQLGIAADFFTGSASDRQELLNIVGGP